MFKRMIPILLCLGLLCSCSQSFPEVDTEQVLKTIVDQIDWDQLETGAQQGADYILEQIPDFAPLVERAGGSDALISGGIDLLKEYIASDDPQILKDAEKLGSLLKALSPEIEQTVNELLEQAENQG